MNSLPMANSVPTGTNIEKLRKVVLSKQLVGLANNTKWNELISAIRCLEDWKPSYRSKSVSGYISEWDVEWTYHLPFPFMAVEWFDISLEHSFEHNDLILKIKSLVKEIGFEFEIQNNVLRIWGYGPKSYENFGA